MLPAGKTNGGSAPVGDGKIGDIVKELEKRGTDIGQLIIQRVLGNDSIVNRGISRGWLITFGSIVFVFILALGFGAIYVSKTLKDLNRSYVVSQERLILAQSSIDQSNDWESLPGQQRRERLKDQTNKIVEFYTLTAPDTQKMTLDQESDFFNTMWLCSQRVQSINFFLPMAYMKAKTNFNPIYNTAYKRGIAALYLKDAETLSNLPLIVKDPLFQLTYLGEKTTYNPSDSVKLLWAKMDDLSKTFSGREDWMMLTLFTNVYDVVAKYWDDGKGQIPDSFYTKGELADALRYYHAFKAWQIPAAFN